MTKTRAAGDHGGAIRRHRFYYRYRFCCGREYAPLLARYAPIVKKYAPIPTKYAPQTQKYDSSPQNATKTAPPETTATRSDGIDSIIDAGFIVGGRIRSVAGEIRSNSEEIRTAPSEIRSANAKIRFKPTKCHKNSAAGKPRRRDKNYFSSFPSA